MKKLILLGVICGLIASCSTKTCNTEDYKQAYIERSVDTCVKEYVADHPKQSKSEAYDYCECVLSKFTDEMSVDELLKYGKDDQKTEEKANKLLNKYSKQCNHNKRAK